MCDCLHCLLRNFFFIENAKIWVGGTTLNREKKGGIFTTEEAETEFCLKSSSSSIVYLMVLLNWFWGWYLCGWFEYKVAVAIFTLWKFMTPLRSQRSHYCGVYRRRFFIGTVHIHLEYELLTSDRSTLMSALDRDFKNAQPRNDVIRSEI